MRNLFFIKINIDRVRIFPLSLGSTELFTSVVILMTVHIFTRSGNLPDLTEQVYFIFLSSADNL